MSNNGMAVSFGNRAELLKAFGNVQVISPAITTHLEILRRKLNVGTSILVFVWDENNPQPVYGYKQLGPN